MTDTTNRTTTVRLSPETRRQLDALAESYGTRTSAIAVAVDRLHQAKESTPMTASIIWTQDTAQLRMGAKGTGRLIHSIRHIDTPASIEAATTALYDEARMRGLQIVQPVEA